MLTIKTADAGRIPLFQAENERLGVNHCMAGSRIVKAWRLEGALGDVITYHHNYGEYTGDHRDVLCGVIAANYYALTEGIGFSGNRNPEQVEDGVLKTLGMDWEMFDEIRPSVDKEIEKAQIFLNL
jgi:HD-like signal output (HDOD) protein